MNAFHVNSDEQPASVVVKSMTYLMADKLMTYLVRVKAIVAPSRAQDFQSLAWR
jgi:hypothetical protein